MGDTTRPRVGQLSAPEWALLERVVWKSWCAEKADFWQQQLGPLQPLLSRFHSLSYVRDATKAERLDRKYKVPDLKELLSSHGLPKSGKKSALVQRLMDELPTDAVESLVASAHHLVLTPEGDVALKEFYAARQAAKAECEARAMEALRASDIRKAESLVDKWREVYEYGDATHMPRDTAYVRTLLALPLDDLEADEAYRATVRASLALSAVLGEHPVEAGIRIFHAIGDSQLPCPALLDFARNPVGQYASSMNLDDPQDQTELYAHTKLFALSSAAKLQLLKSERVCDGVEILDCGDDCPICTAGKLQYRWSELDKMPTLPRHWGCRCTYIPWFAD